MWYIADISLRVGCRGENLWSDAFPRLNFLPSLVAVRKAARD
jgi:hypothetical protein